MKTKTYLLIGFTISAFLFYTKVKIAQKTRSQQTEKPNQAPENWMTAQRAYPFNKIDKKAKKEAVEYRQKKLQAQQTAALTKNYLHEWEFRGPTNVGGRITDIEMRSDDTQTIYAGTAAGGIFKLGTGNSAWQPIFDDAESLAIGDMAIAPSNEDIIYVGTGEANGGGGSLAYDGYGVYKSIDAGDSWQHLGLENVGSIGKVVVDANDSDRVYVAAMGDLFGNNPERGVYRSLDGGTNWEQVLFVSDSTGMIDMAINPDNPNIIFAAAWERTRVPNKRVYGGITSDIYRSMDGGDSWQKLTNGLPNQAFQKGRIGLAIAPSAPNIIYASYAETDGPIQGLYKSTNNGDTWTSVNSNGLYSVPYMWWFGKMTVDPNDANTLYHIGFVLEKSTDGGQSWSPFMEGVHVDQHAVFVHPQDSDLIVAGNDGGAYLTTDGGAVVFKFQNMPITQYYTCEIDHSNPERLYGGSQDNSTNRTLTGSDNDWEIILGGDGFRVLVDPTNSQNIYAEYQYGNFFRSTDGGTTMLAATNGISGNDRRNWNSPAEFDPNNPSTLYFGTNRLYRSTNKAQSWTAISPDLSNGNQSENITFGTITTISVSPVDTDIIYAGTDDGNVWVTSNGGTNWTKIAADLPNRWVTSIAADPFDPNVAYVTLSGYRFHEDNGHVYRTDDQGATWNNIGNKLPDVPVNDIVINPNPAVSDIYIATDIGVLVSFDLGESWEILGVELPNIVVTDLDYHAPTTTLVAATYGRSMYSYQFDYMVATQSPEQLDFAVQIYPNPVRETIHIRFDNPQKAYFNIRLYNVAGQAVQSIYEGELPEGTQELNNPIKHLPTGTYVLHIESKGNILVEKIVVEN